MKNKILLLGLVVLGIVMSMSLVSAYTPYAYTPRPYECMGCVNCGTMPYTPTVSRYYPRYAPTMPIRIGGFFGAGSANIIGLRPGTFYQAPCMQRQAFFYQGCNAGGYGSGGYGYSNYGSGGYGNNYMYQGPF